MSKRTRNSEHLGAQQKERPPPADREHVESLLDRALADTFPASDPVSTLLPDPPSQPASDARSTPK